MAKLTAEIPLLHDDVSASDVEYGRFVEIGEGTRLSNVAIGDYSYTDRYADLANVIVGKFSNIAAFSRIGATDHPLTTASLHHFLYRSADYWDDAEVDEDWFAKRRSRMTIIGHDTWIGAAAQIRPDVTIGHGAVVGANAVVTKDVAPYMIVAGNPAKLIRPRFEPTIVEGLIALSWWDWSHDLIRERLDDFRSLTAAAFVERYS